MKKALSILSISLLIATSFSSPSYAGNKKLKRAIAIGAAIGAGAVILKKIKDKNKKKKNKSTSSNSNGSSNRSTNKAIQSALNAKGFNAGTPDGVLGKGSRAAISSYQQSIGAEPTGKLTKAQQASLLGAATLATTAAGAANISSQSDIKLAQSYLNWLGYHGDSYDGVLGPNTRYAIREFQKDHGYPMDGKIHENQLNKMLSIKNRLDVGLQLSQIPEDHYKVISSSDIGINLYPSCRLSRRGAYNTDDSKEVFEDCGFVNEQGDWAIAPIYDDTSSYYNGNSRIVTAGDSNFIGLRKADGTLKPYSNLSFYPDFKKWVACNQEKKCGILDNHTNNWEIAPQYEFITQIQSSQFLANASDHKEVLDAISSKILFKTSLEGNFWIEYYNKKHKIALVRTDKDILMLSDDSSVFKELKNREIGEICEDFFLSYNPNDESDSTIVFFSGETKQLPKNLQYAHSSIYSDQCDAVRIRVSENKQMHWLYPSTMERSKSYAYIDSPNTSKYLGVETPHLIKSVFVATNSNYSRGIVGNNGEWILSPSYQDIEIENDLILMKRSTHDYDAGMLYLDENERVQMKYLNKGLYSRFGILSEGKFKFIYGDLFDYSAGNYSLNSKGKIIPNTTSREIAIMKDACSQAIGNTSKKIKRLIMSCEKYFLSEGEKGNANAYFSYAYALLFDGQKEGIKYAIKSAEMGYDDAQAELAINYYNGLPTLDIPKDMNKALYWFEKAAENGDVSSQKNLGVAYMEGVGVEKNLNQALYWLRAAAEQGDENAIHDAAVVERYLRAQNQPRQVQSKTVLDVFNDFSQNQPSASEKSCQNTKKSCISQCEGLPYGKGINAGFGPYGKCKSRCRSISC